MQASRVRRRSMEMAKRKQREKMLRAKAKKSTRARRGSDATSPSGRSSPPNAEGDGVRAAWGSGNSASPPTSPLHTMRRHGSDDSTHGVQRPRSASLLAPRSRPSLADLHGSPRRSRPVPAVPVRRSSSLVGINHCDMSSDDARAAMLVMFNTHDGDGDGSLEPYELLAALSEQLHRDVSAKSVAALFARTGVVPCPASVNAQSPCSVRVRRALALAQYQRGATQPSKRPRVNPLAIELGDCSVPTVAQSSPPPRPGPLPPNPPGAADDTAPDAAGSKLGSHADLHPAAADGETDEFVGVPCARSTPECPAAFVDFDSPERTKLHFTFSNFIALHDHLVLKPRRIALQTRCKHDMTRMYHPCEPLKIRWDSALGAVLMYSLVVIPFRVCLNVPAELFKAFWWIDLVVDVYFLVDMCFTFRTGIFENANGGVSGLKYIDNACAVAKDYLKLWFWIDLVTSLPISSTLEVIAVASGEYTVERQETGAVVTRIPRMLRVIRILRLLKLLRLAKLARLLKNWQNRQTTVGKLIRFGKLFGSLCFIAHLLGCTFCFVGGIAQADDVTGELPDKGWLVTNPMTKYTHEDDVDKPWIYLLSLYWAVMTLTTVGYGDITPTTTVETLVVIGAMFIGTCSFGYIVGSVTSVIMEEDRGATLVREKIDEISSYMRSRKLTPSLQERVREYFDFVWKTNTVFDENQILEDLPPFLRDDVIQEAYGDLVREVPMLARLAPSELTALVVRLKPLRVLPSQVIVRAGECGVEMYIVSGGLLRCYCAASSAYPFESFMMSLRDLQRGRQSATLPGETAPREERPPYADDRADLLARGDYFGEYCIIEAQQGSAARPMSADADAASGGAEGNYMDAASGAEAGTLGETDWSTHARHPSTVVAIETSLLLYITRMQFEECHMLFPHISTSLAEGQQYAQEVDAQRRLSRVQELQESEGSAGDDESSGSADTWCNLDEKMLRRSSSDDGPARVTRHVGSGPAAPNRGDVTKKKSDPAHASADSAAQPAHGYEGGAAHARSDAADDDQAPPRTTREEVAHPDLEEELESGSSRGDGGSAIGAATPGVETARVAAMCDALTKQELTQRLVTLHAALRIATATPETRARSPAT